MIRIKGILKSNKGLALVTVMIYFMILSILTTSAIFVSTTIAKQVVNEKEHIQAYYLAYSGVEICYSAIINNSDLFKLFKENSGFTKEEEIFYDDISGDKMIIVAKTSDDKEKITITSEGIRAGGRSVTLVMSFLADFPDTKKWE